VELGWPGAQAAFDKALAGGATLSQLAGRWGHYNSRAAPEKGWYGRDPSAALQAKLKPRRKKV
jgi:hypothetical protein